MPRKKLYLFFDLFDHLYWWKIVEQLGEFAFTEEFFFIIEKEYVPSTASNTKVSTM